MNKMYNIWGLRFDDRDFSVGEEIPKSHRWDGGVDTGEELSGTCAVYVSDESDFLDYLDGNTEEICGELNNYRAALEADYPGKHIYLVAIEARWGYEVGEDEKEIIMCGPEVVRKIK